MKVLVEEKRDHRGRGWTEDRKAQHEGNMEEEDRRTEVRMK